MPPPFVETRSLALLTDLYELTMLEAYLAEGMLAEATFGLFVRRLPKHRRFLLACGLDDLLDELADFRFDEDALAWLAGLKLFSPRTLAWLRAFRFRGEVRALPEGTPFFEHEPLVELRGSLPEVQLVETLVMNQLHVATLGASKAARIVLAARGKTVVDFGVRRMHGADAGVKVARAAFIAGAASTSDLLAGKLYGLPVAGTMAHSFVQASASEHEAFAAMARAFPTTTLLVDTYDTLEGAREVVRLAHKLGPAFRVRSVRLDSGDLLVLSREARDILDQAGLQRVSIFASGGLDEYEIARLLDAGAPIDAFGVGTALGVSDDAPALDFAYKLVEYDGVPRIKLSSGKVLWPGRKQVFRHADRDTLALAGESYEGRPLLETVMVGGQRVRPRRELPEIQAFAKRELAALPPSVRELGPGAGYPVDASPKLVRLREEVARRLGHVPSP